MANKFNPDAGCQEIRTYQSRLSLTDEQKSILDAFGELYGRIERNLYRDLIVKAPDKDGKNALKRQYIAEHGITARHYNALRVGVEGKARSVVELRATHLAQLESRIKKAEETLAKLGRKIEAYPRSVKQPKWTHTYHQKQRRLAILNQKRTKLEAEIENKALPAICFGSRKLFHAQYNLEANGFASHEAWLAEWKRSRSNELFFLGSKTEGGGNQTCVATVNENGYELRIRLPDALSEFGKYLVVPMDALGYGNDALLQALDRSEIKTPITYRFVRDKKSWKVFISTEALRTKQTTKREYGSIGVDLNADHLAVTEIDRFGNPIQTLNIPTKTKDLSSHQASAVLGDGVKALMTFAVGKDKPIVIERLDFAKKKAQLENENPEYAEMLSSLAYNKVKTFIKARAYDNGIEVLEVNPAYSSQIGKYKYAHRYSLSVHEAAACVIARRGFKFTENPNRRDHVASSLPARNREKHVWSFWAGVSRSKTARQAFVSVVDHPARRRPWSQAETVNNDTEQIRP